MANNALHVRLDKVRLEALIGQSPQKAGQALRALALEGERIVKMSFNSSPPGRRYKRGSRIHIASQPNYAPNVDTGKLMNGVHVERRGVMSQAITTGDTEYAAWLEYGTSKMAPRPYMRPMVPKLEQLAPGLFDRFLE